jgi:general stress protein YciG
MSRKNQQSKEEISCREAGRRGGQAVKKKYGGTEFYSEIGKKGGRTTAETHGPDFYAQIGKKGGKATKRLYGDDFYKEIGTKGGARVKELIAKAKRLEE